jgi:hypothetical protein
MRLKSILTASLLMVAYNLQADVCSNGINFTAGQIPFQMVTSAGPPKQVLGNVMASTDSFGRTQCPPNILAITKDNIPLVAAPLLATECTLHGPTNYPTVVYSTNGVPVTKTAVNGYTSADLNNPGLFVKNTLAPGGFLTFPDMTHVSDTVAYVIVYNGAAPPAGTSYSDEYYITCV